MSRILLDADGNPAREDLTLACLGLFADSLSALARMDTNLEAQLRVERLRETCGVEPDQVTVRIGLPASYQRSAA